MKNLLYTIILVLSALSTAHAQFDSKNIYGGGHVGLAITSGELSTYVQVGFSYSLEFGYNINEKLSVGLEIGQIIASGTSQDTIREGFFAGSLITRVGLYTTVNFLAKSHYRFSTGKVQPFVGLGLGATKVSEPAVEDPTVSDEFVSRTGLAICPEVGISVNGLVISYSFSHYGRTPKETFYNFRSFDLPLNFHEVTVGYVYNF